MTTISLVYCLLDRGRRLEYWMENRAGLIAFSISAGIAIWLFSLLMQRNGSIPFLYFQF